MVFLLHYSSGPILALGILQNDINHGATIHSVLHVRPYTVVLKSTFQRVNTQFTIMLCIAQSTR